MNERQAKKKNPDEQQNEKCNKNEKRKRNRYCSKQNNAQPDDLQK